MYKTTTVTCLSLTLLAGQAFASTGQRIAEQMQQNHDTTPVACDAATPAHACSGVLLRTTTPSPRYHTWHHSPNNRTKGGVSFSYLRADIPTTRLAAGARSGFTLYPDQQRPTDTLPYKVLCAWPTDGDSWSRRQQGCGDNHQTPDTETACHEQDVHDAEAWIARFRESGDYKQQCAFDVRLARGDARAQAFYQSIRAKQLFADELPFAWNEVVVATWDEQASNKLPIQSFFYIYGEYSALDQAQADQRDWFESHGAYIPVIRLQLPADASQPTLFSYHEDDQRVDPR